MPTKPADIHYTVLDSYRFLGAIGVLAAHYLTQYWGSPTPIHPSLEKLNLLIDFFTVLSGVVMAHNYAGRIDSWRSYGVFMQKRLARIYPLHLLTTLLFAGMAVVAMVIGFQFTNAAQLDFHMLPANLLLVQAWGMAPTWTFNGPSWTLSAELAAYLLLPLFLFLARRYGPLGLLAITIVYTAAMQAVRQHYGLSHWAEATYDFGQFRALAGFGFGVVVERFIAARNWRLPFWPGHLAAALVVALMLLKVENDIIIAAIVLTVALLAAADRVGSPSLLASRKLAMFRDSAFGLYLWHIPVSVIFVTIPLRLFHLDPALKGPLLAVAAVLSLVIAYASYLVFETPARRWISGLHVFGRKRKPTPVAA